MMNQNTKNYVRFLKQLKDAQSQEDVDAIVKASHSTLTPHSFAILLVKIRKRRNELPDRDAVQ